MNKPIALFVSTVLLLVMAVGCSRRPNDEQIQKDIQTKAATDPETKDSDVIVAAKDGKVTLSGKVKTPAAQKKVEQIAQQEPGNTGIDDQTSIEPEAPPPAEAPQVVQAPPPPPPIPAPKPQPIVVPAGTVLTVRMGQSLSSKTSQTGQTFLATLGQPVSVGGRAAIPDGSTVSGTVVTAKAKGRFKGEGQLTLALTSITVRGHTYTIQTGVLDSTVKGKGKRTAATTGGGAAGGALIGGLAGGGKGAGIGALVGAGAGLVGGAMTGNQQMEIPAESALSFRLSAPLTLPPPGE
jgi:BON domain